MIKNIFSGVDPESIAQAINKDNEVREALFNSLEKDKDYFVTTEEMFGSRNVLKKSGAEVIANQLGIKVSMGEIETLKVAQGGIVFTAKAYAKLAGEVVAEGISSRSSITDTGDLNTTVKMMYKSAYIDVILRATGMTRHFTQDIPESQVLSRLERVIKANDPAEQKCLDLLVESVKESLGVRLPFVLAQRSAVKLEDLSYSELVEIASDEFIEVAGQSSARCDDKAECNEQDHQSDDQRHDHTAAPLLIVSTTRTAVGGLTL